MSRVRKARFFWVYPLAAWLFLAAHTSEWSLRLGMLIALIGEALRVWANGYVGHAKVNWTQSGRRHPAIGHLVTTGPYAHVRHPLYVGTFLIGTGFCLAVTSLWGALSALAMFCLLYRRKAMEEEALIADEYGEVYEAYRRVVPRWIPTWRSHYDPRSQWSWKGLRASREWKTLLWVVVGFVVIYFREEFWQEHEVFVEKDWFKHVMLAVMLILLIAVDGVIEVRRRIRRSAAPAV
ncbi:MAG: isoprenylcysteine carboxylmethyltransferase family protein [Candidatus Omnitrophica bacterium]|nr:isoprenylcysteine carboxylmethyltransferase family protein [Candidatus Omnitrophota bacterium]